MRTAATGDFAELCAALLPCKTGSVGRLRKSSALILELIAPVAFLAGFDPRPSDGRGL